MRNEGQKAYFAKAKMEAAQRMFALWQEAGNAKAHATVDYVQQLVDQGRKVVVFYHHTRAWETIGVALGSKGIRYCTINGKVTGDRRMTTINDFQNQDSDTMVCLAQIGAAGVGVTLTAAADAVFAQLPWSAGDFKQAMDRILRTDSISMQRAIDGEAITWHILQACQEDGTPTIDGHLFGVLQEKSAICDAVNAGRPVTIDEDTLTESLLQAWYPSAQAQYRP
jgi:superfamily II DNA/RNA helicase